MNVHHDGFDILERKLRSWPKDEHIDEEQCEHWTGSGRGTVQYALLRLLDAGVLRMNGFQYFIR